jgi:hypothetical protein
MPLVTQNGAFEALCRSNNWHCKWSLYLEALQKANERIIKGKKDNHVKQNEIKCD